METPKMNYRFTAILILMTLVLVFFTDPAYPYNQNSNTYMGKDFIKKLKIPKYLTEELPKPINE